MIPCPKCGKEIAEGAIICKHCGAEFGTPKRPTGITVIAVLCFIGAAISLLALPSVNRITSLILGIRVPVPLYQLFGVAGAGLAIYCGVGFLQLREIARKIYLYWAIFSVLNSVISPLVVISTMRRIRDEVMVGIVIGIIIGVGIYGYILYYLVRRKDYFIN